MKINTKELAAQLTRDQTYLVSAWNNMVHALSVDSHRVRVANVEYLLAEYQKMFEPDKTSKGPEKKQVRLELIDALRVDPIILHRYKPAAGRLLSILESTPEKEENGGAPLSSMARYSISEVGAQLQQNYMRDLLQFVRDVVIDDAFAHKAETERFRAIWSALNSLLSTLISRGASLQSLYSFYRNRLLDENAPFVQRWDSISAYISSDTSRQFHVVVAIDDVSRASELPAHVGGFNFFQQSPLQPDPNDTGPRAQTLRKYLRPFRSRLFASVNINARDARSAGEEAFSRLNTLLDLLRFEYETSPMGVPDMFAYQAGADSVKAYKLGVLIPNPGSSVDSAGASEFVQAVNELVSRQVKAEGLDRIHAAFRLYRTGLDTHVLENKYLNWWTALEYLVKSGLGEGIGNSVENQVAPVLGVSYLEKHLIFHRAALLELQVHLLDAAALPIELKSLSLEKLYQTLLDPAVRAFILGSVDSHPYVRSGFDAFFTAIASPASWKNQVEKHEQRVRAHLQRLWRARCDIVHSASRPASLVLLCANLEYYLKTVLLALLRSFREIPTMTGPREFFDRQQHAFAELKADLARNSDMVLRHQLTGAW